MTARLLACTLVLLSAACAATHLVFPGGTGVPAPEVAEGYDAALVACRGVRTLTAEISVSGHAGLQKIRGRVLAGFSLPGSLRLEAPAPFGAPIFILAGRENRTVLLLPRDRRVLRDAPVDEVIEALTGLRRDASDLLALVSGCLISNPRPIATQARRFPSGWGTLALGGDVEALLHDQRQRWLVVGGRQLATSGEPGAARWTVSYDEFSAGFPAIVRVWQALDPGNTGGLAAELTLRVSQRETNVPIDAEAFSLRVPPDAVPMTIEELRQSGPLADTRSR